MMMLLALAVLTGCQKKEEAAAAAPAEKAVEAVETVQVDPVEEAAASYFADYPGSRIAPASDVFAMLDAGDDIFVLDIRQPDVYSAGHIKGAVNAPWGSDILVDAVNWLPADKKIYVNCYTGQTAGQTTAVLNVAGFDVTSIKYGWNLGISKTEGFEGYVETAAASVPEASGTVIQPEIKEAVQEYFTTVTTGAYKNNIIASSALKELVDTEEGLNIVSVRQPKDFDAGHIMGAINIPFGAGMQEAFADLPRDETVFVYCYSGQTAGQTVGIMRLMGIDAVSVKSGMGTAGTAGSGWSNEGFETVM